MFLLKVLGWFGLCMMILNTLIIIGKDGESTIKYTDGLKIISLLINIPIIYFISYVLFRIL